MLQLFRKNLFIYNLLLLVYCSLLRLSWFFSDLQPSRLPDGGILSRFLYDIIGDNTVILKYLVIFLLLYHAVQINRIVSLNRLTSENSLFPGLFYILMSSITLEFIPIHPQLLANTFIILMLLEVFRQTRNIHLHIDMFNMGLWAGLASLFYFPYILFLVVGILGVIYLRTYKWADTVRALMGVFVPYFLLCTILFLFGNFSDFWLQHGKNALSFLDLNEVLSWKNYVLIGIFALLILSTLAMSGRYHTGMNIHIRKKITVIFMMLIGALIMMILVTNSNITSLLFLTFPLSILMAAMFLNIEPQVAEILHFLLVAAALVFQYLV